MTPDSIIQTLSNVRFSFEDEKALQVAIARRLTMAGIPFIREFRLDKNNIFDFYWEGLVVEVKIKGGAKKIYSQCKRYCQFKQVTGLVLITNRSMGFPEEIAGKPCYVINLGKAWL